VSELVYRLFARISRLVGLWPIRVGAFLVATGFFLFLPRRLGHSLRFYRALYPDDSSWFALKCAWRQYQDFARLYSERLEVERREDVVFESEGDQHLAEAKAAGRGAILLMSHFGRWEIGARLLARRQMEVTLVMGLRDAGLDVLTIPAGQGQSLDILQAMQVLRQGGIVSLAADRAFGDARMLHLPFLGGTVGVAAAPFALALTRGAPLLIVFATKIGRRHYRFACDPPILLRAANRADRQQAMERAAATYLSRLEAMAKSHPEQWEIFGGFFLREGKGGER